jgi:formate C-acetyltransferase
MFNLLKVMEIVLQENEGQPDVSWDGLISQIRDKIRHYIKLMVEGSNICDIGHRDWAPVPCSPRSLKIACSTAKISPAARAITSPASRASGSPT